MCGASEFTVAEQPAVVNVPPAGQVSFKLAYTPAAHSSADSSTVRIASNDADQNPCTFTVGGQSPAEFATHSTPSLWLYNHGLADGGYDAAALSDTDHDGMLAWEEYVTGTDPTDGGSVFRVTPVVSNGAVGLEIPAISNPGASVLI